MAYLYFFGVSLIFSILLDVVYAQYSGGAIAGAVLGSIFGTLLVVAIILALLYYCKYRKKPKENVEAGEHDDEKGSSPPSGTVLSGIDNPLAVLSKEPLIFDGKANGVSNEVDDGELKEVVSDGKKQSVKEQPEINGNAGIKEQNVDEDIKPNNGEIIAKDGNSIITVALDDKPVATNGFNIVPDDEGNIFVRDVRKDGPADGKLLEGDIVTSVTVFYDGISHEDALNILSYSAPYKIAVSVVRGLNDTMPEKNLEPNALVEELQQKLEKRESKKDKTKFDEEIVEPKVVEKPIIETSPLGEDKKHESSSSSSISSSDNEEEKNRKKSEKTSTSASNDESSAADKSESEKVPLVEEESVIPAVVKREEPVEVESTLTFVEEIPVQAAAPEASKKQTPPVVPTKTSTAKEKASIIKANMEESSKDENKTTSPTSSRASSSSSGKRKKLTKKRSSPRNSKQSLSSSSSSSGEEELEKFSKRREYFEHLAESQPQTKVEKPSTATTQSPHVTTDREGNVVVRSGKSVNQIDFEKPEDVELVKHANKQPFEPEQEKQHKSSSSSTSSDEKTQLQEKVKRKSSSSPSSNQEDIQNLPESFLPIVVDNVSDGQVEEANSMPTKSGSSSSSSSSSSSDEESQKEGKENDCEFKNDDDDDVTAKEENTFQKDQPIVTVFLQDGSSSSDSENGVEKIKQTEEKTEIEKEIESSSHEENSKNFNIGENGDKELERQESISSESTISDKSGNVDNLKENIKSSSSPSPKKEDTFPKIQTDEWVIISDETATTVELENNKKDDQNNVYENTQERKELDRESISSASSENDENKKSLDEIADIKADELKTAVVNQTEKNNREISSSSSSSSSEEEVETVVNQSSGDALNGIEDTKSDKSPESSDDDKEVDGPCLPPEDKSQPVEVSDVVNDEIQSRILDQVDVSSESSSSSDAEKENIVNKELETESTIEQSKKEETKTNELPATLTRQYSMSSASTEENDDDKVKEIDDVEEKEENILKDEISEVSTIERKSSSSSLSQSSSSSDSEEEEDSKKDEEMPVTEEIKETVQFVESLPSYSAADNNNEEKNEEPATVKNREDIQFKSGWRKAVKLLDLIRAKLILESTVKKLEKGEISEQSVENDLKQYLQGEEPVAGLLIMKSGKKISLYDACKAEIIRRGTAVSLLEAQAATGNIINPVNGERMGVSDAASTGLIDKQFESVLLRAERAVHGYKSRLAPEPLSLFAAMKKKLVVESHGIRLLEAQIATGGIIDPYTNHRIPVDVAYERGLFDTRLNDILEDPSDDTKGFFDPNTNENLTYLDLMGRCVTDEDTKLRLLPLYQGEERKEYERRHKSKPTKNDNSESV